MMGNYRWHYSTNWGKMASTVERASLVPGDTNTVAVQYTLHVYKMGHDVIDSATTPGKQKCKSVAAFFLLCRTVVHQVKP